MTHRLILGLFDHPTGAAAAARALHAAGVARDRISVVSRNHDEEGALAQQMNATPGAEVEESRPAARLGELSGLLLATLAFVMPGVGPIVAAGPLSAGLGEAAGHVAGGVAAVLSSAGVEPSRAQTLQEEIEHGAVLLGVHDLDDRIDNVPRSTIESALLQAGARDLEVVNWPA